MASTQNIARALREKFGSEETIVKLSEILAFLDSHQNHNDAVGQSKQLQLDDGSERDAQLSSRDATRNSREQRKQHVSRVTPPPSTTSGSKGWPGMPSYAEIAGKAPEKPTKPPKHPKGAPKPLKEGPKAKPLRLPESIKLALKAPKPIKIRL